MFKAAVSLKTGYKMRVRWGGEGGRVKKDTPITIDIRIQDGARTYRYADSAVCEQTM